MKTLNELYTEVAASDELKSEFLALKTPEDLVNFAKKNGCDATLDEIKAFFEEKQKAAGELSEAELEQVAGGKGTAAGIAMDAILSIVSVGVWCAIRLADSATAYENKDILQGQGIYCQGVFADTFTQEVKPKENA